MQQIKAARETIDLINARLNDWTVNVTVIMALSDDLKPQHLEDMVVQMEADDNPQGRKFSEAKLGRWLGWIQAAGTALGVLTLDDCKNINLRWTGK